MQIAAYLNFDGDCEDALRFYAHALGGEIECIIPFEGTPGEKEVPAAYRKKVIHGRLKLNGQIIMASDCPPERYKKPQGISINLGVKNADEAERVFASLADGGNVTMPLEETFWAVRFGAVTDRFGIPWLINCEKHMQNPARDEDREHEYAGRH